MRKKLISMILSIVIASAFLSGCTLIVHNDKKDAQQVVATISPITETRMVEDADKQPVEKTFKSSTKRIYKSDLVRALNQNAEDMIKNQGMTQNEAVDKTLEQLTMQELLLIEADRLQFFGDIMWTRKEDNQVLESIYSTIDNQLATLKNNIYKEFKETVPSDEKTELPKPTYPIKPEEKTKLDYKYYQFDDNGNILYQKDKKGEFILDNKGEKIPDYLVWAPDKANYPAMYGTDENKSLERESVLRFVQLLKDLVKDDFKATAEDKKSFVADDKAINDVINTKGVQGIYPMLGETHYMQYLVGKSAKQSVQVTLLQKFITDNVKVSYEEVKDSYDTTKKEQVDSYNSNIKNYETDVSGGTVNVVYNKSDSYFYVKHILLPFSAEQTAKLKLLKEDPKNADDNYKTVRDTQFVNETVVYAHVNGENDLSHPKTVKDVFDEISSQMERVKNNSYEAERLFDEFVYKYNTDPGIFDKAMGYAVKRSLAEGEKGAYMEEFEALAREMLNNKSKYGVGSVGKTYAVTDYGVHIMYLANTITAGSFNALESFQTPGKYKTYYELFEEKIKTNKENAAFDDWQAKRIEYYKNKEGVITKFAKRYKSLYTK